MMQIQDKYWKLYIGGNILFFAVYAIHGFTSPDVGGPGFYVSPKEGVFFYLTVQMLFNMVLIGLGLLFNIVKETKTLLISFLLFLVSILIGFSYCS